MSHSAGAISSQAQNERGCGAVSHDEKYAVEQLHAQWEDPVGYGSPSELDAALGLPSCAWAPGGVLLGGGCVGCAAVDRALSWVQHR